MKNFTLKAQVKGIYSKSMQRQREIGNKTADELYYNRGYDKIWENSNLIKLEKYKDMNGYSKDYWYMKLCDRNITNTAELHAKPTLRYSGEMLI
jgi:hypothetical protein